MTGCLPITSANEAFTLTLSNSGGGLFPLHKFDKAQTAFRVIVNLVDFVRSLERQLPCITLGAERKLLETSKGIKKIKHLYDCKEVKPLFHLL